MNVRKGKEKDYGRIGNILQIKCSKIKWQKSMLLSFLSFKDKNRPYEMKINTKQENIKDDAVNF